MRFLSGFLVLLMAMPLGAQTAPGRLNLVVVEGQGAINNIRQRTAREPIVQVEDENHKPVAGAAVVFTLPSNGAGGTFANGARTLTVMTDNQGQAAAHGFQPNSVQGKFQIRVTASQNGRTATTVISQTNAAVAGAAGAAVATGISLKVIAIVAAVAGAAVAGGVVAATRGGGNNGNTATVATPVTVTPGTGTVGPPR
jgi:hypothetical protein